MNRLELAILIIGWVANIVIVVTNFPQAIKTIRTRSVKDLSLPTYITLTIGLTLWVVYGGLMLQWSIVIGNIISLGFVIPILIIKIIDVKKQSEIPCIVPMQN